MKVGIKRYGLERMRGDFVVMTKKQRNSGPIQPKTQGLVMMLYVRLFKIKMEFYGLVVMVRD